jgi:hypothetical protein
VACLRQLVTREAKEVSVHALALASDEADKIEKFGITETGMEGKLFGMCDTEVDGKLISDLQDTLVSLLQTLATKDLTRWLNLLREILSSSTGKHYIEIFNMFNYKATCQINVNYQSSALS